jgi:CheY-like chemotaxis protein
VDHIDLLLTDVVLPKGMNGPELAREARARRPGMKVLYMSGYPRAAIFRNGALDADTHLLSKPFAKSELARMVRGVMDEKGET